MGRNFPIINKLMDKPLNFLSNSPSLVLIQEREHIACVICQRSIFRVSVQRIFRVSNENGLTAALSALEKLCRENGFGDLWRGKVQICLHADFALFADFQLPPSSRRKMEKTIPILLDEELPLPPDSFVAKNYLTKDQGYYAIATVIQKSVLEQWRECLENFEFGEARLTIFPWPLLQKLPSLKASALLICFSACGNIICALNDNGQPLRIRTIPRENEPEHIARQTRLLLSDMNFEPDSLLVLGGHDSPDLIKTIRAEYDLPMLFPGRDSPLGGGFEGLEDDNIAGIVATCLNSRQMASFFKIPFFRLKFKREKTGRYTWAVPAALCLALSCGCEVFSLYNSMHKLSQSELIKKQLVKSLQKDLDNIPKNASSGRLMAILNSRLAEMESQASNNGGLFVSLLEDIHRAAPLESSIGLNRLTYDAKHIRLSGNAGTYQEVNTLKNNIEKMENIEAARIINAAVNQGSGNTRQKIDFELDLVLK